MTKEQLKQLLEQGIVYIDGATGTNLQKAGMETGECPEKWILDHEDVMVDLQKSYFDAGSHIVLAPTFTANRVKLEEYGLADRIEEINKRLVAISKKAANGRGYVAGDMTMTGEQLYPIGTLRFEELVDIYKEQARYLVEAGVDLFFIETMMSLSEARACVLAIKETTDLPIFVSMTYNEDGRTLYGTDPVTATIVLENLGVDAVGINCSTGPKEMIPEICGDSNYCKAKCRASRASRWRDHLCYDTRRICPIWKRVDKGRSVYARRMLWNDTRAYKSSCRGNKDDGDVTDKKTQLSRGYIRTPDYIF